MGFKEKTKNVLHFLTIKKVLSIDKNQKRLILISEKIAIVIYSTSQIVFQIKKRKNKCQK